MQPEPEQKPLRPSLSLELEPAAEEQPEDAFAQRYGWQYVDQVFCGGHLEVGLAAC